jgi:hypothetical protein
MAHSNIFKNMKFKRLLKAVAEPVPHLIGHLECLWHVAYNNGDARIGSADDLELAAEWDGEPGLLAKHLIEGRWVDDVGGIFYVHDFWEWSPKFVKDRLRKQKRRKQDAAEEALQDEAEEGPKKKKPAVAVQPVVVSSTSVEEIYGAYPRKLAKQAALASIRKALDKIETRSNPPADAAAWLLGRVLAFAKSPAGNRGEYTPHPSTWFNQGRYDDDDSEWNRGGDGSNSSSSLPPELAGPREDISDEERRQLWADDEEGAAGELQ